MTDSEKLSPAGRLTLWVLGSLLFLAISSYRYYL